MGSQVLLFQSSTHKVGRPEVVSSMGEIQEFALFSFVW